PEQFGPGQEVRPPDGRGSHQGQPGAGGHRPPQGVRRAAGHGKEARGRALEGGQAHRQQVRRGVPQVPGGRPRGGGEVAGAGGEGRQGQGPEGVGRQDPRKGQGPPEGGPRPGQVRRQEGQGPRRQEGQGPRRQEGQGQALTTPKGGRGGTPDGPAPRALSGT